MSQHFKITNYTSKNFKNLGSSSVAAFMTAFVVRLEPRRYLIQSKVKRKEWKAEMVQGLLRLCIGLQLQCGRMPASQGFGLFFHFL